MARKEGDPPQQPRGRTWAGTGDKWGGDATRAMRRLASTPLATTRGSQAFSTGAYLTSDILSKQRISYRFPFLIRSKRREERK